MPIVAPTQIPGDDVLKSTREPLTQGLGSHTFNTYDFDEKIIPGLQSDRFATPKGFTMAVGPALYEQATPQNLALLGACQDFNNQQNRALQEIFEIGSRDIYQLTGRVTRQVSLGRMMFYGPTLMRALYEGAEVDFPANLADRTSGATAGPKYLPGLDKEALMFLNLDSIFFETPTGLLIQAGTVGQRSTKKTNPIGAAYLEEVLIRAYGLQVSANQPVVSENVVLTYTHTVPIQVVS